MRIGKVVILPVLLAVGLLVGGLGALAQTPPGDQAPTQTLLARVATTLGIQEQALKDAFVKAQGEMQMEALTERLKNLVEKGTITQDQADQYLAWQKARPNIGFGPALGRVFLRMKGRFGSAPGQTSLFARVATILGIQEQALKDAFTKAQREIQMEALTERLKKQVEQGKITQQQADQYLQWWQARPDSLPGHPWALGGRFGGPPGWFKGHRLGGMMPGKGGPGPTN